LYTSNPKFVPNTLDQVEEFAENSGKFYTCIAPEGSQLADVEKGAHILSAKGNNIYILDVSTDSSFDYATKCNIQGIVSIDYPFGNAPKKVGSIKNLSSRIKDMFVPVEADNVRISINGDICVATNAGYVAIDKDNVLKSYPEEMTIKLPAYIISKPKDQIQVGDIVAVDKKYYKVTRINGDKLTTIGYTGSGKIIHTITDVLFNASMVRVVMSITGMANGQINPIMLMALGKDDSSLLPLLMMNQNNASLGINPFMLMALKNDNISTETLLMMSMMNQGANPFANLFQQPQSNPVVAQTEETQSVPQAD
jgi:hypothetical protein